MDAYDQETQQQQNHMTEGPPREQCSETPRIEMHQSQLLKTNQLQQSILLKWQHKTSRPHRLMETSSINMVPRDLSLS